MPFVKARRSKVWLKLGLMGPSGAGKTYSALVLAKALSLDGPVAGIDTENESMQLYSHLCDLYTVTLAPPFQPRKCVEAIRDAVDGGYRVLVIDSMTHFWKFILEQKDALDRSNPQGRFTNWGKVKPQYEELKEAILQSPIHIICCSRAKDAYVIEENADKKSTPKKVGLEAISEPGQEFEYTTFWELSMDHYAGTSKDRTGQFDDIRERITEKTGLKLLEWLDSADNDEAMSRAALKSPAPREAAPAQATEAEEPAVSESWEAFGFESKTVPAKRYLTEAPLPDTLDNITAQALKRCPTRDIAFRTALAETIAKEVGFRIGSAASAYCVLRFLAKATDEQVEIAITATEDRLYDEAKPAEKKATKAKAPPLAVAEGGQASA